MVDKTKLEELQQQLLDIQAEIDNLKNAQDTCEESVLPLTGSWYISETWSDSHQGEPGPIGWAVEVKNDQNIFPTRESAEAYRNAFSVMLKLRRQPGSCYWTKGVWYVGSEGDVVVGDLSPEYVLSPAFISEERAQQALEVVGRDKIIAAYNTMLYGVTQ